MNLSGRSVAAALRFHKLTLQDVVVVHDDLDVPFGRLKLKEGGGHAGHNGLRSLVQELGGNGFVRVRVGIGRPQHGDVANYVLTNFLSEEAAALPTVVDGAVDSIDLLLREGLGRAMAQFNNRELF
jgi:PTH1 family peptidyl-tRNA hydrolase